MRKAAIIFVYFLFVRVAYILLSGFDTCQLCADCGWINMLSERVLAGNFDFDVGRFIVSPFYNIFIAAHKFMFRDFHITSINYVLVKEIRKIPKGQSNS